MKIRRIAALIFVSILLTSGHAANGNASDSCDWRAVELADGTTVELLNADSKKPRVFFVSSSDMLVRVPGSENPGATIPSGETVELTQNTSGQVSFGQGRFEIASRSKRYAILKDSTIELTILQGTRFELTNDVTDGKLPAGTIVELDLSRDQVSAQLSAPFYLKPIPQQESSARLATNALPITRGGRTITVELFASGWNRDQLTAERFQACFAQKTRATMASVVDAKDGWVTLDVPVPEELNTSIIYNSVDLTIFGPTHGILSNRKEVHIGNPIFSIFISVFIVALILAIIAHYLPSDVTGGRFFKNLFSFTIGVDGRPSLSLFQIYIWTVLVLIGMVYVFLMSGDLLNISQQVLVLVGLAGVGSISARWISVGNDGEAAKGGTGFWDMFVVSGKPDLLRLQLFLFTITIWVYVAARVFYEQEFPELDPNVLLLMGISNGVYVGAKWAATGDPTASLRKLRLEVDTLRQAVKNKSAELKDAETKLAGFTDPGTQKAKTGQEQQFKQASDELAQVKKDLDELKKALEKAEKAFKAETDRLAKT